MRAAGRNAYLDRRGSDGKLAVAFTRPEWAWYRRPCRRTPFRGGTFVFRGRRGHLIKLLWWDSDGLCLFGEKT